MKKKRNQKPKIVKDEIPRWFRDVGMGQMVPINGHWFEVVSKGIEGFHAVYKSPTNRQVKRDRK